MQPAATESIHETSTVTAADTVLVLRCIRKDMTSRNGFVYPTSGPVTAPDWDPKSECGNGLHGWLWGVGDLDTCDYHSNEGTRWMVLAVDRAGTVDLGGKVKFRTGTVVFVGDRPEAVAYVVARCPRDTYPMFGVSVVGYGGTATAGDYGTATAGDYGTATAGYQGTATAGYQGTATAGYQGTATAGYGGTATAGNGGTATAGYGGRLLIEEYRAGRFRIVVGYVGEDGIRPNVKYRLDGSSKFVEA